MDEVRSIRDFDCYRRALRRSLCEFYMRIPRSASIVCARSLCFGKDRITQGKISLKNDAFPIKIDSSVLPQ